ncbi:hypothetical protein E2C01_024381 [Portunus trituberculatus]|uniref:Uncharacterized protein n=1 Tax=Portunus trituberculatus TaxID=210409 RepID=A0A5B7EAF4_PORTR|nr:hypothetical protein [Portunus trituberculatus]
MSVFCFFCRMYGAASPTKPHHLFLTETRGSEATGSSSFSIPSYFLCSHFRSKGDNFLDLLGKSSKLSVSPEENSASSAPTAAILFVRVRILGVVLRDTQVRSPKLGVVAPGVAGVRLRLGDGV